MHCNSYVRTSKEQIELSFISHSDKATRQNLIQQQLFLANAHLKELSILSTKQGKPFIQGGFPYSVSHTSGASVLAISVSKSVIIGIDLEKYQELPLKPFIPYLSSNESNYIQKQSNPFQAFLQVWTKKEAFLKAIGTGLQEDMKTIDTTDTHQTIGKREWGLEKLDIQPGYFAAISWQSIPKANS